jgi:glycogen operon protein
VLALRKQQMKNHACYLLFSCGTPMILGGDEFGRTQRGNNNAYCQDNEISWFDWNEASRNRELVEFFRKAIAFTSRFPVLQQRKFLLGRDLDDDGVPDLEWFSPDGGDPDWQDANARTLCYQLDSSEDGAPADAERLFLILNGDFESRFIKLPPLESSRSWFRAIDTSLPSGADFADRGSEVKIDPGDHYMVNPRSVVVLLAR